MTPELPAMLLREGMQLLGTVAAPVMGALLVVGLLVGVLQAATQINDPAVGALPRLIVAGVACMVFGGWMVTRFAAFFISAVHRMAAAGLG